MDENTDVSLVKQDPYNMPTGFEWCSIDINNPMEIAEVYQLLSDNYVEDDDCLFRFDYSVPFLQWALTPPGFRKDWHVGVRNSKTGGGSLSLSLTLSLPLSLSVSISLSISISLFLSLPFSLSHSLAHSLSPLLCGIFNVMYYYYSC
jgi:hypothetical protein